MMNYKRKSVAVKIVALTFSLTLRTFVIIDDVRKRAFKKSLFFQCYAVLALTRG